MTSWSSLTSAREAYHIGECRSCHATAPADGLDPLLGIPCSVEQGSNPSCLNTKTMDYVIALSLTLNLVHPLDIVTANSFQESLAQDVISCQRQI